MPYRIPDHPDSVSRAEDLHAKPFAFPAPRSPLTRRGAGSAAEPGQFRLERLLQIPAAERLLEQPQDAANVVGIE